MPRYIDKDAAIELLKRHKEIGLRNLEILCADEDAIIRWLETQVPIADAVKVVRCRDCKYYERGECYHPKYDDINQSLNFDENDFCSYGEQRGEKPNDDL